MEKEFKFIITCASVFTSPTSEPETDAFLERICDSREKAEALLEDLAERANRNEEDRNGFLYSDPIWQGPEHWEHFKLQVTVTHNYGCKWVRTYCIHQELEKNYLSKTPWL